ncbi:MAG: thermonuclease family protein [Candidatus Solibacter usitatus]|nr:thermonuclease family protein [Candidatus Solibacter usitatus]
MSYKGILRIQGTLDLKQFWPSGESDADTTKVLINVAPGAFTFQASKAAPAQPTSAFDDARLKGMGKKTIITKGRVTVRLQGIDAPELHYAPSPLGRSASITDAMRAAFHEVNRKYRQNWGQSAAKALHDALAKAGAGPLDCEFFTYVDAPNDVCDRYGRMVGDVAVKMPGGKTLNINTWVLANGWALPSFYDSMSKAEIKRLMNVANKAEAAGKGLWSGFSQKLGAFNFKLLYAKGKDVPGFAIGDDSGMFLMPKIFRRQCTWACYRKAGITSDTFLAYMKKKAEKFHHTPDFLANGDGAAWVSLGDYVKKGEFTLHGDEIVNKESPSTLLDDAGAEITAW